MRLPVTSEAALSTNRNTFNLEYLKMLKDITQYIHNIKNGYFLVENWI